MRNTNATSLYSASVAISQLQLIYGALIRVSGAMARVRVALTVITVSIYISLNGNDQTNETYFQRCWCAER